MKRSRNSRPSSNLTSEIFSFSLGVSTFSDLTFIVSPSGFAFGATSSFGKTSTSASRTLKSLAAALKSPSFNSSTA